MTLKAASELITDAIHAIEYNEEYQELTDAEKAALYRIAIQKITIYQSFYEQRDQLHKSKLKRQNDETTGITNKGNN